MRSLPGTEKGQLFFAGKNLRNAETMTLRPFLEQQASSGGVSDAGVGTRARGVGGRMCRVRAGPFFPLFLPLSLPNAHEPLLGAG